jgi:hypothetical protein
LSLGLDEAMNTRAYVGALRANRTQFMREQAYHRIALPTDVARHLTKRAATVHL